MIPQLASSLAVTRDELIYDALSTRLRDVWNYFIMSCCRAFWAMGACLSLWTALSNAQDASVLSPYAQPTGLSDDITQWLATSTGSQIATCKSGILANINIPDAANGTVVASTSTENPNYHFNCMSI
jgi:hypothetical protein